MQEEPHEKRRVDIDDCTFMPDLSLSRKVKVAGLPVEFVEQRLALREIKKKAIELEIMAQEAAQVDVPVKFTPTKWRDDSESYRSREKSERVEESHAEEEDYGAVAEKMRKRRLKRNAEREKRMHRIPVKREERICASKGRANEHLV
jgi:hypothetical protein